MTKLCSIPGVGKPRSDKIHELPQASSKILIDVALLDSVLRAVMKVLGKCRYYLPVWVWKVVMTIHCAVDMPSFPVI